jgi:hypothetical protein
MLITVVVHHLLFLPKMGTFQLLPHYWNKKYIIVNHINNDGFTALISASKWGHCNIVALLLKQKEVNVNHANRDGQTALLSASNEGHTIFFSCREERKYLYLEHFSGIFE